MKKIAYKVLPAFLIDLYIKKIKRPPCIWCDEVGVLELNEKEYVCENCAQIITEIGDMQDD